MREVFSVEVSTVTDYVKKTIQIEKGQEITLEELAEELNRGDLRRVEIRFPNGDIALGVKKNWKASKNNESNK